MTTPSPIARTIKCLLAALLAHACTVNAFDNPAEGFLNDFTGFSTSSASSAVTRNGLSSWLGGTAAAPASSSGSWFSLPTSLPSISSLFSGAGSSSSTQSSPSGQSSFSPSATQLAIGAAGAAAASLTTYYLYNLYKKLNEQYAATEKYYRPILAAFASQETLNNVDMLDLIAQKQGKIKPDLNQFKNNLVTDIDSLSPLKWAAVGAPLYNKIVTPTKVAVLKDELLDLLDHVDHLLSESKEEGRPAARPRTPDIYDQYNELLDSQNKPDKAHRTNPWNNYTYTIQNAIDQEYPNEPVRNRLSRLLNIIKKSPEAFSLFIESQKAKYSFVQFVKENPNILNQMPPKLGNQLRNKLHQLGVDLKPILDATAEQQPAQPASTQAADNLRKKIHGGQVKF